MAVTETTIAAPPGRAAEPSVPDVDPNPRPHPRKITWIGASSLAMGGSNQSIFLIAALVASQGGAAIPILMVGLLLSFMAAPGWIELSCMFPNRVGGIAATCAEAFRPYSAVLANLTGVSYWWGWVPTCGVTALFSASAIQQWYMPGVPLKVLAPLIVLIFVGINLCGLKWATRVAVPIAVVAAALALLSSLIPIFSGTVDWHQAASWHLNNPLHGVFGGLTSWMAGLYLVGFAAPAFEAAASHIGEMKDPKRDQPTAMWVSAGVACIYFVLMPVVWLGALGTGPLASAASGNLAFSIAPTFAPLVGALAKSFGVWFIFVNMFSGTLQPLSGASRTLSQLSEDGLLPRSLGYRHPKTDAPVVAIVFTGALAIAFQFFGASFENKFIASANLTYLIGIGLPSIAVWILRKNHPDWPRLYLARRTSIRLGVVAAFVWLASTVLGFEQFGLGVIIGGLALAYSGAAAYAWRIHRDRVRTGTKGPAFSLHMKLTGAMLAVLTLDAVGYGFFASKETGASQAIVYDIFVAVALLTITVGLVLPGMIAHTADQVTAAARRLGSGTLRDLRAAMASLAAGNLREAHASVEVTPVEIHTRDEFAIMASEFNVMQAEAAAAATSVDITADELRKNQAELRQLSVVASDTESLVIIADPQGKIEWVNPAFEKKTGYTRRESIGRTPGSFLQGPGSDKAVADHIRRALREGRSSAGELLNYTKDGTPYWVSFQITPIFDEDGRLTQFISVQNDTTDRKIREQEVIDQNVILEERVAARTEELEEAKAVAEEATRAKGLFLANMSHEIRTPLNAIIGLTHLSLETDLDEKQAEYAAKTDVAARHLLQLVTDILDFSKLDAGALVLEAEAFDLDEVLEKIRAVTGTLCEEKNLSFSIACAPDVPRTLVGDAFRLEQVLLNLTSNAKKFTSRGSVDVTVALRRRTGDSVTLEFSVIDTGIGIEPGDIGGIFEEFSQADATTTRQFGGTGLGLAISKDLVELMGGTISVVSTPGLGSTFSFDAAFTVADASALPAQAPDGEAADARREVLAGAEVLVAEDNPFNQLVIVEILEAVGVRVTVADNGVQALDQLKQHGPFDVVLMDMQMPDMDGLTATRRIRSGHAYDGMPVVALTANAGTEFRAECLEAGMDDFASKPIEPEELYATVARWVSRTRDAAGAGSEATPQG